MNTALADQNQDSISQFDCEKCGAELNFDPRAQSLTCAYCNHVHTINIAANDIQELDFHAQLEKLEEEETCEEIVSIKCETCAATNAVEQNNTSFDCLYCASPIVASATSQKQIKPKSLLPFKVEKNEARQHFQQWLQKLWFAPTKVKQLSQIASGLKGIYLPFWTFDSKTVSTYSGMRGNYYYVNETYSSTEDGKTVEKTREVRKTRWSYISGTVFENFDDQLSIATTSLSKEKLKALEPWDLENLVPYKDDYLSGFSAQCYEVGLEEGFKAARKDMDSEIRDLIRRDIGGDEQCINAVNSQYNDITFKHVLLPAWISSYKFNNKSYQIMVNARTGEVQAERPYSWIKITSAALASSIAATLIYFNVMTFTAPESKAAQWYCGSLSAVCLNKN